MGLEFRDGVTRCNPQNRPIPTPSDMAAIDARNAVRFQGLLRAVESRVCEGRLVLVAILEHHFAAYVDRPENRQLLKEVGLAASRLKVGCEVEKYDTFLKRLAKDQHSLAGEKKELKFGNHSRYDQAEAGSVDGQIVKDNGSITVHTSLPIVDSAPSRANWRRRHEALPLVERLDVEVEYPGPLEKTFTIRPGVNVVIYIDTCIAFYWTHIVTVIKRFKGPISIVIVEEVRKEISRQASWVQGASRRAKRILGQQILAPRSLLPPQKVIQYSNTGTRIVDVKGDLRICHEISLDIQARQAASTEALVCLVLSLDCGFGPTFDGIGPQTADVRIPFLSQYPQSPYHWISNDKSSQGLQGLRPGGFLPAIHYMLRDVLVR